MIEITEKPISPERIANQTRTRGSGCAVSYIGLIREHSRGKPVLSVEYTDPDGTATSKLKEIAEAARQKWPLEEIAICHRTGKLNVGDINLVVVIAAAHRKEGFAASQYVIDRFKQALPTRKRETYTDGSSYTEG